MAINDPLERYLLDVGEADRARMTLLGGIYQPYNSAFMLKHGLQPGMAVADMGCGPGSMTLWLAQTVGADGSVLALDASQQQLALVEQEIAAARLSHVTCAHMDIYAAEQLSQRFDVIFCRFVLTHLKNPQAALRILVNLLKPGGRLFVADFDNRTWYSYPNSRAVDRATELLFSLGELHEADFAVGPKLYGYLREIPAVQLAAEIVQPVLTAQQRHYVSLRTKLLKSHYLEHNLATADELEQLIHDLQRIAADEQYLLAGASMFQVCATRKNVD